MVVEEEGHSGCCAWPGLGGDEVSTGLCRVCFCKAPAVKPSIVPGVVGALAAVRHLFKRARERYELFVDGKLMVLTSSFLASFALSAFEPNQKGEVITGPS